MDLNLCHKEITSGETLDHRKTYLTTPYYKTIPIIDNSGPTFGPQYNYSNYDKFCLNTNLQPIFASLGFTFDINSINIDGKMVLCIVVRLGNNIFSMSEKTQYRLQHEVDFVCSNLYHLCLLFDVLADKTYPRGWLISIFPHLEISKALNPTFIGGKLYLSLVESIDYSSTYSDAFDNLMIQISQLYNTGAIICDQKFAKKWNLSLYRDGVYISEWIDNRITADKASFLFNILSDFTTTIDIPDESLYYHRISGIFKSPLIDKGKVQLRLGSIDEVHQILEIISKEITEIYTITQILLPSHDAYIDLSNKIMQRWGTADIAEYRIPDPHRSVVLSVLILDQIDNLKLEINKFLG